MSFLQTDKSVILALLGAATSIAAALIAAITSARLAAKARKATLELEDHKNKLSKDFAEENARLAEHSADQNARRDYDYEGKKRLYAEIQPLLFQLFEALEESHYRVRSLARTSRDGNLSWLSTSGYYLSSSAYKLILPAVYLRLIQRQMTFVDLKIDESINVKYQLLKLYSRSFTDDFDFARLEPKLPYDPNHVDWPRLRENDPAQYYRQALLLGDLENICDALIPSEDGKRVRVMTFGEFESLLSSKPVNRNVRELIYLLIGFTPTDRPVFARLLTAQAIMAQLILSTYPEANQAPLRERLESIVAKYKTSPTLNWFTSGPATDFDLVLRYWQERLNWISGDASALELDM